MPTASELLDNRATILARIHRRRHHSGLSPSEDEDDEDSVNRLIVDEDHLTAGDSPPFTYHRPFHFVQDNTNNTINSEEGVSVDPHFVSPERNVEVERIASAYDNGSFAPRERRTSGGGKWPRQKYVFNSSSMMQSGYHKRKCDAKNCVHQYGSSCADILLQPHLYPHICKKKGKAFNIFGRKISIDKITALT